MIAHSVDYSIPADLKSHLSGLATKSLAAGLVGIAATIAGLFLVGPDAFYQAWLFTYIYILSLMGGALVWLIMQYSTGGAWGVVIRRPAEAASRTIWLVMLLFVPIVLGMNNLYPWMHADYLRAHETAMHKTPYLNTTFWIIRAAVYLVGWAMLTLYYNKWSVREDEGDRRAHGKMSFLAGPGMIFHALAVTFMALDWVMSQDATWFSTMWGLLFIAGHLLTGIAFLIAVLVMLSRYRPMSEILTPRHLHDLGKLMLAVVMVWAYFSFSQFLIVWAGNLPQEIPYYKIRMNNGWGWVGLILVFGHFALPFALLLSRDLKRNFKTLRAIAVFVLCMRLVDTFWMSKPFAHESFSLTWLDITAPLGLVGIWFAYFFKNLQQRPLLPLHDPNLEETLEHGRSY